MVVFDATIILALLHSDGPPPRHPETNEPVDRFRERIDHLIEGLEKDRSKIIIPTPTLSEVLVRANAAAGEYLDKINATSAFRPAPFDERAAVEVAAMTREALARGDDKRDGQDGTWAKIKYDRQIVAIAKVEGAKTIYSDDKGVFSLAKKNCLAVIRVADLPLPPEKPQQELDFDREIESLPTVQNDETADPKEE